ncbi:MAG: putative transglutaminase [Frankiales bacterium]|nr:putative transglutaminase [Frankiales bacterium]
MSWRLRIVHTTGYRYDTTVTSSYNEARLTPITDPLQLVLESSVRTSPATTQHRYWDYWGTQVTSFDLHTPHEALEVTALSVVDTAPAPAEPVDGVTWDALRGEDLRDLHAELLAPSDRTAPDEEMVQAARDAVVGKDPYRAARAVLDLVHERVAYQTGSTGVQTGAVEAWRLRTGVCQDLAHVALACLRSVGLPARYVSGYLHPAGPGAEVGEPVTGESHAWVEVWLGRWWPYDVTGLVPVAEQHVVVARGREYGDVPPLKGVYSGGGSQSLGVSVEVTRLG